VEKSIKTSKNNMKNKIEGLSYGQVNVIKILMRRDGSDYLEAKVQLQECVSRCNEALENGEFNLEDIIQEDLGLEPDYLMDILPEIF
jgi:hypothetical protein